MILSNKQANKFHTFLSNCFNKMGHKVQIIIIKFEVFDYLIPKSVKKNDTRNNIILHLGMSSSCPAASIIGLKNIIETSTDCKLYWEGKSCQNDKHGIQFCQPRMWDTC